MTYLRKVIPTYRRRKIIATCKYIPNKEEIIKGLFEKNIIRFTQPWALNDPLEASPELRVNIKGLGDLNVRYRIDNITIPSYKELLYLNIVEARYNRYGVLSLSRNIYNYDMWNLYANAHKGFIIDFKQGIDEKNSFNSNALFSGLVKYVKKVELKVDQALDDYGYEKFDYLNDVLFLQKTMHWQKEKEYRIIRPLFEHPNYSEPDEKKSYRDSNIYLFSFNPNSISSIVFGAQMDPDIKKMIITLTQKYTYDYFQCIIDKSDNYMLYYLPIELWKNRNEYLVLKPQVFITNGNDFNYFKKEIMVKAIDEIPYCKNEMTKQYINDFLIRHKERMIDNTRTLLSRRTLRNSKNQ
jgi:hypothetical protein